MNGIPLASGSGSEGPAGGGVCTSRALTRTGEGSRGGNDDRLAAAVFALLVLGCFAALLVTQRLKHTPTPVQAFKLTHVIAPASSGEAKEEHISFRLSKADTVTVTIEAAGGEDVATLVRDLPVARYKTLSLRWNGRRGAARGYGVLRRADGYTTLLPVNHGRIAAPGEYRVRVNLRDQGHSVPSPRTFKLVGG